LESGPQAGPKSKNNKGQFLAKPERSSPSKDLKKDKQKPEKGLKTPRGRGLPAKITYLHRPGPFTEYSQGEEIIPDSD